MGRAKGKFAQNFERSVLTTPFFERLFAVRLARKKKMPGYQERYALHAPSRTGSGRSRGYVDDRLRRPPAGYARPGHNSVDCGRGQAWPVDNALRYPPPPPSPPPAHRVAPRLPGFTHIPPAPLRAPLAGPDGPFSF